MNSFLLVLFNILEEGLIYGVMALGLYITYRVLSFPDLSVDGTFPLGGCVSAVLILNGIDPAAAMIISFFCGSIAGLITGILHVKLKITDLLSGILVMTAMWSINLAIVSGKAVLPFFSSPTIFSYEFIKQLPTEVYMRRVVIILTVVVAVVKYAMDWFLGTKSGLLLRAVGNNEQFTISLSVDSGRMKILGLMLCNGLAALSGSILAQQAGSANVASGTGMMVMALASVIIGLNLFGKIKIMRPTTMVILGSIVYKACLAVSMQLGLPANYLKLLMSILFIIALVSGKLTQGRKVNHNA